MTGPSPSSAHDSAHPQSVRGPKRPLPIHGGWLDLPKGALSLYLSILPAPEPFEQTRATPTDSILSRLANPGLILPIHWSLSGRNARTSALLDLALPPAPCTVEAGRNRTSDRVVEDLDLIDQPIEGGADLEIAGRREGAGKSADIE